MSRTILTISVAVFLLTLAVSAAPPPDYVDPLSSERSVDNETYVNANNILMFITNHGGFGRDLEDVFQQDAGTFYPFTTVEDILNGTNSNYVQYAAGLWIGGLVDGSPRVTVAEYGSEYVPGPMIGDTSAPDDPSFHVYKLYSDSLSGNPNSDYINWPAGDGAPTDFFGDPEIIGDQMTWSVFNDADPFQHANNIGSTDPLGVEVRHTTFAWDREDQFANILFLRWRVYNNGGSTIENCYLSLWSDPDLGGYTDDFVGCDTMLNLGFCYNGDDDDQQYGFAPPCLGYDLLQGPLVYTGDIADTGRAWGQLWPGHANLEMTAFAKYVNGTDPNNYQESYNLMQGLRKSGDPYVYGWDTLTYWHSGDPVAGTGDLDFNPADRRMMLTTGPLTMNPGDSVEIIAALLVGHGDDRLASIIDLREKSFHAQSAYEYGLEPPPTHPTLAAAPAPDTFLAVWANSINPVDAYIAVGYDECCDTSIGIDPATLLIDLVPVVDSMVTVASHPGFVGTAHLVYFDARQLVQPLGTIWGVETIPIDIAGNLTSGQPFVIQAEVKVGGHIPGDLNTDGIVDISDLVALVDYMFSGGPAPKPVALADVDGSCVQDISDIVYMVENMFFGGPPLQVCDR